MSDLNEKKWRVKRDNCDEIVIKAYKFEIEGNSIVFKNMLGRSGIFTNTLAYPSNSTVVEECVGEISN